jgi:16S rRNA (guanine527-N7)-methyltransferase
LQESQPIDLKSFTASLAAAYPELPPEHLHKYYQEILRWNPRVGMVSKQGTVEVIGRLIRQSVGLLELVRTRTEAACGIEQHVVDIGSGGGFPGLVWAMIEPDWRYLLVERRHKKAAFLERMVNVLGLEDVEVYAGPAEDAQRLGRFSERFDAATAMAVGPPVKTASLVEGFLRSGRLFVTTIPRDEPDPPERSGTRLRLLSKDTDGETVYALYMKH